MSRAVARILGLTGRVFYSGQLDSPDKSRVQLELDNQLAAGSCLIELSQDGKRKVKRYVVK